ncbi:hypothetical protein ALQ04_03454 [Pseudomonas cichorii]|uniref:Uncharacterized protein n=1 Tax=Pseudomonas cichorii TaxID=36746 RepID=A0A3M4M8L5_PSECI|nr:hypothetical protein [Pseudomonas cichorii]RMQ49501.1 hypothetical protein ALQ04_03454 [Pseudomonas cichorii]
MKTSSNPISQQSGHLTALQIPSIDLSGNNGLGWDDLKVPHKGVALFAVTPPDTVKGDLIELLWNGKVVQSLLAHPERPSIDFSVLPQDIPDEPQVSEVFYRITPAAGGTPADSPVRKVRVKRSVPGGLDTDNHTPYINDNLAPVENLPANIETLADLPLSIAAWDNMQEGDVLRLFWTSSEFPVENPPLPADQVGKQQTIIVNAALQTAAGNGENLTVYYEIRDQVSNWSGYSLAAFTSVDILVLSAPSVSEAPEGVLDPVQAAAGATLLAAYPGMLDTDNIRVRWDGQKDATDPVSQPGNQTGSVEFTVTPAAIASVLGRTLEVSYVVTRHANELESDTLSLTVQALPSSSLPTPQITQAQSNKVLKVDELNGDADLTVAAWPLIATGQRIWLRFKGTARDGSAYSWNHPVWQDFSITNNTAQSTTVALSELQKLKLYSNLQLIMEVSFDGGLTRIPFPINTLSIVAYYPVRGSEDWESFPTQLLPIQQTLPFSDDMSLFIELRPLSIVNVGTAHPIFGNRTLEAKEENQFTIRFYGLIKTLKLSHFGANPARDHISFYDIYDKLVVDAPLESGAGIVSQEVHLSQACFYCRVYVGQHPLLLDNLSWTAWTP